MLIGDEPFGQVNPPGGTERKRESANARHSCCLAVRGERCEREPDQRLCAAGNNGRRGFAECVEVLLMGGVWRGVFTHARWRQGPIRRDRGTGAQRER